MALDELMDYGMTGSSTQFLPIVQTSYVLMQF